MLEALPEDLAGSSMREGRERNTLPAARQPTGKYPSINILAFLMASRCMEVGVGHRSIVISHQ